MGFSEGRVAHLGPREGRDGHHSHHGIRQDKHIVMTDGTRQVTIPRHNPIQAFTLGGIVQDAGLTVEEFRQLP